MSPNIILIGDFNVHFDKPDNMSTQDFKTMLEFFELTQYVNFITHTKGHILDLVCSCILPYNITSAELPISDHKAVLFNTNLLLSKAKAHRVISNRNIRHVHPESLISLITSNPAPPQTTSTLDLMDYYNDTLSSTLDTLAPLKTQTISFTYISPWYTSELRQLKAVGRRKERLYKKTGLAVHKQMYNDHILLYKNALSTSKNSYYANIFTAGEGNAKTLFSTVKKTTQTTGN